VADVSPPAPRRGSDGPARDSRGQLILVTALSLAILFVSLALILNTAIYTENLATRSGDIGGATDAVRYHDAAHTAVGGIIEYANANNQTDHGTLEANLSEGVDVFRNYSARQFSAGDRAVETELESTVKGTRLGQSDANRNFTNASGTATDWTLATGVDNARAVTINVTDETALGSIHSAGVFNLTLDDGAATWRLNVSRDGSTTVVGIKNGADEHVTCSVADDTPTIDLTGGTVGGEPCAGLAFAEGLSTAYEISFESADKINGTFSMVVDDENLADNVGSNDDLVEDGAGQPFAAHAIYSADVTVVYETPRLYYNTTVHVAPEEPDG
jgi:hypothetical protein